MAGQRSKRTAASASLLGSSSPRDPNSCPFEDFLQYLNSSLSRNVFLRLSESMINKMKATLVRLRQNGQKVASDVVERVVSAIDAFQEACSQLHPSAFVAIVRILIHAEDSPYRDRGLYLLGEFLHNANNKQEEGDDIDKPLHDIGKDCLDLIFAAFCDKSESYKIRRWAGLLVHELTSHCEDNMELIGFMPEDKRRKLGSQVLYEKNEILRNLSGRVLITLVSSGIIEKELLFPEQTEKGLISQYPEQAPSASQWDKRFSSYLDDIWDRIASAENNGAIDFAQNLVTSPEYLDTKTISIYHRSIYVVLSDCIYIHIHSESTGFDTAIDIPYYLVSDIRVEPTALDQSVGDTPPADLILHVKYAGGDQAYVNSRPSELSVVQLTFKDMTLATDIGKAVQDYKAKFNGGAGGQGTTGDNESASGNPDSLKLVKRPGFIKASQSEEGLRPRGNDTGTNEKATKETRVSGDEELLLYGKRKYTNAKTIKKASFLRVSQTDEGAADIGAARESSPIIPQEKILPTKKSRNTTGDDADLYDASPIAHGHRSKNLIAASPASSSLGLHGRVPPIPITALSTRGKTNKTLYHAPTNINTRIERNAVSGMTINTSDEFGTSSPRIHQSPSMTFRSNPTDDTLLPTRHDVSIDELVLIPPISVRPKKRQILKSKKVLGYSKKAGKNGNTATSSKQKQREVSEPKSPVAKGDVTGQIQNTCGIDTALEKVPKHHREELNRSWDIEAESPKLNPVPSKQPLETGKGVSKKRKSELDAPARTRGGTRSTAISVKEAGKELPDGTSDDSDLKPDLGNRANRPSSKKPVKTEQVDGKENPVAAAAVVRKPKMGQKKPLLRSKTALKVNGPVSDEIDMSYDDIGGQGVEPDTLEPPQQHETSFEEALHDYELPNMDDEPSFTPVPHLSAVTKMASKMADMFGFVGESAKPQLKMPYGKSAQKVTRAPQEQPKAKAKNSPKGKQKEEVDSFPESDSLPEKSEPEQKKGLKTAEKSPAIKIEKEVETIYISSDEESDHPGEIERYPPQAIAQTAMKNLDKTSTSASAAARAESSIPALLEAPSDLSPEDQSTPTPMDLIHPAPPKTMGQTKLRNAIDAAHLVDDHLSRKTPIVAFGRKGPKNQGVSSALKRKSVEHLGSETDIAKLINTVALSSPKKRPSPEPTTHVEAPLPKRTKKRTKKVNLTANTAVDDDVCNDDIPDMLPKPSKSSTQSAPQPDSLLCSSQSRVDENGSPHARSTIIEEAEIVPRIRRRTLSIPQKVLHISQNKSITTEKGPFDELDDDMRLAFDDELTVVQNLGNTSPYHKSQIFGRENEATINPRYLSSRPFTAGKNVEVIPETDHATTINSANPFDERQPRQLSNFAKRLKREQPIRPKVTIMVESQPQPPLKAANGRSRKRSFVFEPEATVHDPEKTLVDSENQHQWRRARSINFGGSTSSSDIVDDKGSVTASEDEEEDLTPVTAWKKTLQPPYKNLTDTLYCMVHTLVQDLVDKETAINDIVEDYTRNGTRKVEDFEQKASADRCKLESEFSNTVQKLTRSFQQARATTIALNAEWEKLDGLEAQWRTRQHELQHFLKERMKCVEDGTWKNHIKN